MLLSLRSPQQLRSEVTGATLPPAAALGESACYSFTVAFAERCAVEVARDRQQPARRVKRIDDVIQQRAEHASRIEHFDAEIVDHERCPLAQPRADIAI